MFDTVLFVIAKMDTIEKSNIERIIKWHIYIMKYYITNKIMVPPWVKVNSVCQTWSKPVHSKEKIDTWTSSRR
jgi:hypothetical protein